MMKNYPHKQLKAKILQLNKNLCWKNLQEGVQVWTEWTVCLNIWEKNKKQKEKKEKKIKNLN